MYGPIDHKGKTSTDNAACEYEDRKKKKGSKIKSLHDTLETLAKWN